MSGEHVHTDRAALDELTEAAGRESAGVTSRGAVAGYRAGRTLRLRVELVRQLRRRRTQLMFGFMALLPVLLAVAFEIGEDEGGRTAGSFLDLATSSAPNFVVFVLSVSGAFLLPMVAALFFGDTIASEASWSSLKYLLAMPVPRHRLLRQKAVVSGILAAMALLLLPLAALLVGVIAYGTGEAVSPTGDAIGYQQALLVILLSVGYLCVHLLWVAALALLLSVSTDAPLGAVGGAVLAAILFGILDQITALGDLREFLPTHFGMAWTDLIATDIEWTNIVAGVFSALCFATVLFVLAARRFSTKDITS